MTTMQPSPASATSRVHVERQPTVAAILPVLAWLDVSYLLHRGTPPYARREKGDDGRGVEVRPFLDYLKGIEGISFKSQKHELHMMSVQAVNYVPPSLQREYEDEPLQVAQLLRTSSFDISLDGIGSAVEKVVDSVDPLSRERRREELERMRSINHHDELARSRETATAELQHLIDSHQLLVDAEVISKEEMVQSIRSILAARAAAADALIDLGVTPAIEGTAAAQAIKA